MGQTSCYIYVSSTAQSLSADITWDSNYYVTVNVWSNTSWRLKPQGVPGDSGNIFARYGDLSDGKFQGAENGTYVFQIKNQLDDNWAQDTFTLTSDSSEEEGGGNSGDTNPNYVIQLNDGGYSWDNFPEQTVYWLALNEKLGLPTLKKSSDILSTDNFTIKGNSNGGVADVSLQVEATTFRRYVFIGWFEQGNLKRDPYIVKGNATLIAKQYSDEQTTYSNNTLADLEKPIKKPIEKNYTVKYNSAGGTASKTQEQVTQILSYDFDYWRSDTGVRYDDSSSFKEETEVWAEWKEQIQKESQIILPTVVKYGYKFKGWSLSGQSVLYPAEATVKINGNVEFIAIWEPYGFGYLYCEEIEKYKVVLAWIYAPSGATDARPWKLAIPNIKTNTNWKITAG